MFVVAVLQSFYRCAYVEADMDLVRRMMFDGILDCCVG